MRCFRLFAIEIFGAGWSVAVAAVVVAVAIVGPNSFGTVEVVCHLVPLIIQKY